MNENGIKGSVVERNQRLWNGLKMIMELSKIRITIAVSLTTVTGYVLAGRSYDTGFVLPVVGIFLLACGASVLNHIQERSTDALMERTMARPVPAQRISVLRAIMLAFAEIAGGSVLLIAFSGYNVLLLGYLAILCYNIMYFNLKKVTPHAVIPGSLIGTIPPVMGWLAAGGSFWDIHVLLMSAFFFIWQVPHFYILSLKHVEEYERAGFPTLQQKMTERAIHRMIFVWILLAAISAPMLLIGGILVSLSSIVLIPAGSVWLLLTFAVFLKEPQSTLNYGRYFVWVNFYFLGCVLLMISDPFMERLLERIV